MTSDRDAIVAWLRNSAFEDRRDYERMRSAGYLTNSAMWQWTHLIDTKLGIASAIERGEYLKESPES